MTPEELKTFLDQKVDEFNNPNFIQDDPISIPHQFALNQDIEIAGFFAATLAWGQRKTIINKCNELMNLMDGAPFDFITNHEDEDLKRLLNFKHRTFNTTDLLYFIQFFKSYYQKHDSLEDAFVSKYNDMGPLQAGLTNFHDQFFSLPDFPKRTVKHISTPAKNSACKRLNMFLRWMVRKDNRGVDFGIWHQINPADLICPLDVHVDRVARSLGLINRKQTDWKTAMELTKELKLMDPEDPVKYDFALFGLGVLEQF